MKSARANAMRMRHPPKKVRVATCCIPALKLSPARMDAARDSAEYASIASSRLQIAANLSTPPSTPTAFSFPSTFSFPFSFSYPSPSASAAG